MMDSFHTPSLDGLTYINERLAEQSAEIRRLRTVLEDVSRWQFLRRDFLNRQLHDAMIRWFELVDEQEIAWRAFERDLGGRVQGPRPIRTLREN